ncbi:enoyl-CoA hydratase-related protein, partial [Pseudomonas syringae group genomosp. 7]|uniref:enoyl-CoA hydratase-related protein n=1 Tax=Pseudomonas syringae group genomosp. 7 TaxID=251699 RepID=UPI00376F7765
ASVASQLGKEAGRNARLMRRKIREMQASFTAVANSRKPVLAAIQGYCLGAAIDLISTGDMRYPAPQAEFAIRESTMG